MGGGFRGLPPKTLETQCQQRARVQIYNTVRPRSTVQHERERKQAYIPVRVAV